jgi:hypothetical protein
MQSKIGVYPTQVEVVFHAVTHGHDSENDVPDGCIVLKVSTNIPSQRSPSRNGDTYELPKGSFRSILLDTSPEVLMGRAREPDLLAVSRRTWLFWPCGPHFWRLQDPVRHRQRRPLLRLPATVLQDMSLH